MFAGSCIGVILLVMSLEFVRRLAQEYDRYIIKPHMLAQSAAVTYHSHYGGEERTPLDNTVNGNSPSLTGTQSSFRPSVIQQGVRATLHMTQFAIAYIIMLLAMYYNGYIIICIVIGAWLGSFVFNWQKVSTK
jgi:copper transporter 1